MGKNFKIIDALASFMAFKLCRHALLALGERLNAEEVDELLKGEDDGDGMLKYERNYISVILLALI